MPRRLAFPLEAWLLKWSEEIEDSIGGGFDDWHSDLPADDERAPPEDES